MIYVANVSEEDILNGGNAYYEKVCEYAKEENSEVVMICAKIESELAELNDDDKAEFLKDLGIEDMSLAKLYANIFGKRISKREQLSNWEADILNDKQKKYAATDAWVCREMYLKLMRSEKNPLVEEENL